MVSHFVGDVPGAWVANGNRQISLKGIPPLLEVLAIKIDQRVVLASIAGAFNAVVTDHALIAANIYAKIRGTWNGDPDALNLNSREIRVIAGVATGRDVLQQFLRVGDSIQASGGVVQSTIPFLIPFYHCGLDYPEMWSQCSDQLIESDAKLDLDAGTGANVVLGGGTSSIAPAQTKISLVAVPVFHAFVAPNHRMRQKTISQSFDTEVEPAVEVFFAHEATPAAALAAYSSVTVEVDGRMRIFQMPPDLLAGQLTAEGVAADGTLPYAPERNSFGATAGDQVTPILSVHGKVRSGELQFAAYQRSRTYYQNSATTAGGTFLRWSIQRIQEQDKNGTLRRVSAKYGAAGLGLAGMMIKGGGGGDNDLNPDFKARWCAPRQ